MKLSRISIYLLYTLHETGYGQKASWLDIHVFLSPMQAHTISLFTKYSSPFSQVVFSYSNFVLKILCIRM